MEPYLRSLDLDRSMIQDFVTDFYRHGSVDIHTLSWPQEYICKSTFYFHEDTFEPSISQEIRGPFMEAYKLLARDSPHARSDRSHFRWCAANESRICRSLLTHSDMINQAYQHRHSTKHHRLSWNASWTAHVIVHFYRRITAPEFQTQAHMQIVYVGSRLCPRYNNHIPR